MLFNWIGYISLIKIKWMYLSRLCCLLKVAVSAGSEKCTWKRHYFCYPSCCFCESCRWTGVPGGAPQKRREAKVSLPIVMAPLILGTPMSALKFQVVKMLFTFFGSPLLRMWRSAVQGSLLSCSHAQVDVINIRPLSFCALDCCSVQRRLCFARLLLFYFRLYNCSSICVSTISMLCSGKCPRGAVLTGFFFKSCRLIVGAIRVGENLGKLWCITFIIKNLSLQITFHGFLKHMCACAWTHTQNFSLHFGFPVPPVYFAHSQTSSLSGELALIIASQQLRSELAELKRKKRYPKFLTWVSDSIMFRCESIMYWKCHMNIRDCFSGCWGLHHLALGLSKVSEF